MPVWTRFLTDDDRRGLAIRPSLREPTGVGARPALLVIDMQVTACGHDRPIHEQLDEYPGACGPFAWKAIAVQQRLLPAARAAGVTVIYSKHLFRPEMGLPQADPTNSFSAANPRSEIPNAVAMQPGDLLIEKQTPSCFAFTNLVPILQSRGIDSLLLCGNSTSGCVRATAVDAVAHGYRVQVIEDATFDRIELSHAAAIFDMQFKICDVVGSDEVLALLCPSNARADRG